MRERESRFSFSFSFSFFFLFGLWGGGGVGVGALVYESRRHWKTFHLCKLHSMTGHRLPHDYPVCSFCSVYLHCMVQFFVIFPVNTVLIHTSVFWMNDLSCSNGLSCWLFLAMNMIVQLGLGVGGHIQSGAHLVGTGEYWEICVKCSGGVGWKTGTYQELPLVEPDSRPGDFSFTLVKCMWDQAEEKKGSRVNGCSNSFSSVNILLVSFILKLIIYLSIYFYFD